MTSMFAELVDLDVLLGVQELLNEHCIPDQALSTPPRSLGCWPWPIEGLMAAYCHLSITNVE